MNAVGMKWITSGLPRMQNTMNPEQIDLDSFWLQCRLPKDKSRYESRWGKPWLAKKWLKLSSIFNKSWVYIVSQPLPAGWPAPGLSLEHPLVALQSQHLTAEDRFLHRHAKLLGDKVCSPGDLWALVQHQTSTIAPPHPWKQTIKSPDRRADLPHVYFSYKLNFHRQECDIF